MGNHYEEVQNLSIVSVSQDWFREIVTLLLNWVSLQDIRFLVMNVMVEGELIS